MARRRPRRRAPIPLAARLDLWLWGLTVGLALGLLGLPLK